MLSIGVYENAPETFCVAGGEEWFPPACRDEDGDAPEKDLSFLWLRRAHQGELVLAAGLSLAIHAAVLALAVLLHLFGVPSPEHRGSFITVNLVGPAEVGTGSDGGRTGPGSESGSPYPAAVAQPHTPAAARTVRDDAASREPVTELCSMKARAEMKQEKSRPPAPGGTVPPEAPPVPRKSSAHTDRKKIVAVRESKPEPRDGASSTPDVVSSDAHSAVTPSVCRDDVTSGDCDGGSGSAGRAGHGAGALSGGGDKAGHDGGGPSGNGSPGGKGHGSNRFELKQVDQAPCPIRKVEPEFPQAARRMGVGGSVVVRFLVKADGSVGEASVVRAEPGGVFERNALEAVGKWRFKPGLYRGEAVATWVVLSVQFRLLK